MPSRALGARIMNEVCVVFPGTSARAIYFLSLDAAVFVCVFERLHLKTFYAECQRRG